MATFTTHSAVRPVTRVGVSQQRFASTLVPSLPVRSRKAVVAPANALFPSVADNESYAKFVELVTSSPDVDPAASLQGIEAVLGLTLLSFIGTFIVAPKFKDSFKEDMPWKEIYEELVKMGGVNTITADSAKALANRGAVVVDVRMARNYNEGAIDGSVSVPLYQPISGFSLPANIRRAGFAFFGIYGSEPNVEFDETALSSLPKGKELIVTCNMGGSMDQRPGVTTGFQSQSLKAVYRLKKLGFKKVSHLKGGVGEWRRVNDESLLLPEEFTKSASAASAPAKKSLASIFSRN